MALVATLAGSISYTDTQLIRLGGPNFHEIPINRATAPTHNNQRDGFMRRQIDPSRVSYQPNSLDDNQPAQATSAAGGYVTHPEPVEGSKVRTRGDSFFDHYSQARMFFHSQSEPEKQHIVKAFRFELGKVETPAIRERMVLHLAQVDGNLATDVARGLGIEIPANAPAPPNLSVSADGDPAARQHRTLLDRELASPALSMATQVPAPIASRKVAILVAPGFDSAGVSALAKTLSAGGATAHLVGPRLGGLAGDDGKTVRPEFSILTTASVLFDAVYVAGGEQAAQWAGESDAVDFVRDAFKHCKPLVASGGGVKLLEAARIPVGGADDADPADDATIVAKRMNRAVAERFVAALAGHRLWTREPELHLPL